ncbi:bifunctional ATP-dependent DNA helicase/DNA polymerase III subunit epsilon [Fictibacillus macauensis ZFHKF-1]|uniref:3'-5' exonuclease DinG n=1 Tax=Fictibacillus macauensis ZFHKF-1 TaxID=1196324 RepID=I8UIA2_9BACL|nr:ATP-dependent DNA helicase DinG [Fictibacillus macauensis]EIT86620.1 bifunctional ATP-dependent DNA helicase/DNA polymerase III subunit epsilon [Fictibacillus macauensis ZFHKF-1]
MNNRYVVIDVETTGNAPAKGDRIIQIGAVVVENHEIVQRFSSFVNPEVAIPPFIEQLTGIDDSMVQDAPLFEEVAPTLLTMLEGAYFVAHNVLFDLNFLQEEFQRCGYATFQGPLLDTVELARLLFLQADGYQLNQLADYLGIVHENPHQADSDAEVTAHLLISLIQKLVTLPLVTLQRLQPFLTKMQSSLEEIVSDIMAEKAKTHHEERGFDYYRNVALKAYEPLQRIEEDDEPVPPHQDVLQAYATNMAYYEKRSAQEEMMDLVSEAMNDHRHAIIEAGTGVGKSLGYLIPALLYGKKEGRPIIVSTHTIQLQQQLLERDIPLLHEMMPFDFHATVLKGRNHYLCLRKFEQSLDDRSDDNYDTNLTKAQLLIWLTETEQGDVEELSLSSGGKIFWHQVKSDANSCLNHRCPWFSRCFYHRKRREAQVSDIVITNHALLFTDVKNDAQLLPAYKEVIIDEAHHVEEVVSDHFGVQTDYFQFARLLERLGLDPENGLLEKLYSLLEDVDVPEVLPLLEKLCKELPALKMEIDDLFRSLRSYVIAKNKGTMNDFGRLSYRPQASDLASTHWQAIVEMGQRVRFASKDSNTLLKKVTKALQDREEHMNTYQQGVVTDFEGVRAKLEEEYKGLFYLLHIEHEDEVTWIEVEAKGAKNAVYLFSKPISIHDLLADEYFAKKNSVILTSATLSIKSSFQYVMERLGLLDFGPITAGLPSPFNYKEQVKFMVPTDVPLINQVDQGAFIRDIAEKLHQIAHVTKGRMLVLFTSNDMLRQTYQRFKERTGNDEFVLFAQGVDSGSRARLTKNFKKFEQAILFGTSSFWEGIDIPGDDLSCLVIVRLPFTPPDSPITAARGEKLRQEGGNPFMELALPQAIIRFKQGFGRLVRSKRDRGVVFVLDRRIIDTRYGSAFIQSLPAVPLQKEKLPVLLDDLKTWLAHK